jgi:TonB family protein
VEAGQTHAKDAYLWQVIRKFSQYLPDLRDKNEGGTVVLRFVIARDGRLVEASIARSSGVPALDRGLLESLRAASPYPPLPPEIPATRWCSSSRSPHGAKAISEHLLGNSRGQSKSWASACRTAGGITAMCP